MFGSKIASKFLILPSGVARAGAQGAQAPITSVLITGELTDSPYSEAGMHACVVSHALCDYCTKYCN